MFSVAIQLYSLRREMAADFEGTLKAIADMGYQGVEFAGLHDKSAAEVKALCEKYGLTPVSGHVQVRFIEADPNLPATYREIGTKYLAIPGHQWGDDRDFEHSMERFRAACEAVRATGKRMHYHNHANEIYCKIGDKFQLDAIFDAIPADLLGCEFDVGWLTVAGEDPAAWIRKYAGRTPMLHMKDFYFDKPGNLEGKNPADLADATLGRGKLNVPAVLDAAKDAGVEWLIVELDEPEAGMTALECAKESCEDLKKMIG